MLVPLQAVNDVLDLTLDAMDNFDDVRGLAIFVCTGAIANENVAMEVVLVHDSGTFGRFLVLGHEVRRFWNYRKLRGVKAHLVILHLFRYIFKI